MKKQSAAFFNGYVLENGKRRRATRSELREAHRLWWKHRDVREGRTKELSGSWKATRRT